jgi:hypothetical protein
MLVTVVAYITELALSKRTDRYIMGQPNAIPSNPHRKYKRLKLGGGHVYD